jgi:hypothetical protein
MLSRAGKLLIELRLGIRGVNYPPESVYRFPTLGMYSAFSFLAFAAISLILCIRPKD